MSKLLYLEYWVTRLPSPPENGPKQRLTYLRTLWKANEKLCFGVVFKRTLSPRYQSHLSQVPFSLGPGCISAHKTSNFKYSCSCLHLQSPASRRSSLTRSSIMLTLIYQEMICYSARSSVDHFVLALRCIYSRPSIFQRMAKYAKGRFESYSKYYMTIPGLCTTSKNSV